MLIKCSMANITGYYQCGQGVCVCEFGGWGEETCEKVELKTKRFPMKIGYVPNQPGDMGKSLERQQGLEWTECGHP